MSSAAAPKAFTLLCPVHNSTLSVAQPPVILTPYFLKVLGTKGLRLVQFLSTAEPPQIQTSLENVSQILLTMNLSMLVLLLISSPYTIFTESSTGTKAQFVLSKNGTLQGWFRFPNSQSSSITIHDASHILSSYVWSLAPLVETVRKSPSKTTKRR